MFLSTSQAAIELGVTARQVRRAAVSGRISATKYGAAHAFSQRQVLALERTAHRGRGWSAAAQQASLELLATGKTSELTNKALTSTARSRLKLRIRDAEVGALTGQILRGRVSLRRAANEKTKSDFASSLVGELGLSSSGGLAILISKDATRAARKLRLGLDDSGDIAVIEGDGAHRRVLEALALYMYGNARESSAAAGWIASAQKAL